MTISKKLQIIALSLGWMAGAFAMDPQKPVEFKTTVRGPLFNRIPEEFKNRSLIYYRSLLQQEDEASCGFRTAFHAHILEIASQKEAIEGISLDKSLAILLQNKKSLMTVRRRIQQSLTPGDDIRNGLWDYQLYNAVETYLSQLRDNFLILYLKDNDNKIIADDLTKHKHELFYDMCIDDKRVPFAESQTYKDLIKQLKKPSDTAHFACLTSHHWFLASMRLNKAGRAQLLVFNSTNFDLDADPNIYFMVDKLLEQVAKINAMLLNNLNNQKP